MTTAEEKKQQWAWAVENMKTVAEYAGERDVRLAIEPLNRFETDFINTIEQGLNCSTLSVWKMSVSYWIRFT